MSKLHDAEVAAEDWIKSLWTHSKVPLLVGFAAGFLTHCVF